MKAAARQTVTCAVAGLLSDSNGYRNVERSREVRKLPRGRLSSPAALKTAAGKPDRTPASNPAAPPGCAVRGRGGGGLYFIRIPGRTNTPGPALKHSTQVKDC